MKGWEEIKLINNLPYEEVKSMVSIKMLRTEKGAPNGVTVYVYSKDSVYPTASIPLSEDLKDAFIDMGAAVEYEPIVEPVEPEKVQAVAVAPKTKTPKIQLMNKTELRKFIEDSGLEVDEDMTKKDLLSVAKDIIDDNS